MSPLNRALTLAGLAATALMLAQPAAAGNAQRGLEKSQVCQSCHGRDGNQVLDETYPRLAGQHQDYLVHALKAYRDGGREHAIMSGFARDLSDQDIRDLAAWYASRKGLVDLKVR